MYYQDSMLIGERQAGKWSSNNIQIANTSMQDLFTKGEKQCKYMVYIKCKSLWREIATGLAQVAQPLSHDHLGWPGFTERSGACPLVLAQKPRTRTRSGYPGPPLPPPTAISARRDRHTPCTLPRASLHRHLAPHPLLSSLRPASNPSAPTCSQNVWGHGIDISSIVCVPHHRKWMSPALMAKSTIPAARPNKEHMHARPAAMIITSIGSTSLSTRGYSTTACLFSDTRA
ncbi:hypothetical protein FIBSPDRAFT_886517 [Athelia psychrophila]|uniref:Uncharacterized protein n=1 Tax=Athelia psychrophila TaxID=1759441 RepID=A0A166QWQ5_9AGAM|nr:hypothetical protein FIBSPDRAFT_886517 [Fibularhizoctonia sp. CBS 109695]